MRAIHRRYDDRPITAWRLRLCADLSGAFDPAYLTSVPARVTCKKCLYVMGGHVNSNPDRMTPFSERDLRRIVRGNGKRQRIPAREIGGIRFISGGEGHWYSECGRYAVFHMMRGTPGVMWELYTLNDSNQPDEMIDAAPALTDIVIHARTGQFCERHGWPHEDATSEAASTSGAEGAAASNVERK